MDRVIVDEGRVTVMDFKTGGEKRWEQRHRLQVRNYMRILRDFFPGKTVEGIIGYVDLKEIVRID